MRRVLKERNINRRLGEGVINNLRTEKGAVNRSAQAVVGHNRLAELILKQNEESRIEALDNGFAIYVFE